MKKLIYLLPFIFILISVFSSCDEGNKATVKEKTSTATKSLNPNGDSELALLMRDMYQEAERIKHQVANNEEVTIDLDHEMILNAHATEPEKANSSEFKGFAQLYLTNLESLQEASKEEKVNAYKSLIESCMSCHQAICPGPMVRIRKLRI